MNDELLQHPASRKYIDTKEEKGYWYTVGDLMRYPTRGVFSHDHLVGRHLRYVHPTGRMRVGILNFRITVWRMIFVVFEAVEILVAFPAGIAAVWLVLFHALSTIIRDHSFGIYNGKRAVAVSLESLGIVAVLFAIRIGQRRKRVQCLRSCDTSSHSGSYTPSRIQ